MVKIYRTHQKLLLTLVTLTLLFGSYFFYTWWVGNNKVSEESNDTGLLHFSDIYRSADPTRDYASGALIITDIESKPNFKQAFFEPGTPVPSRETISEELSKVQDFSRYVTASSAEHVFNASYYVGNYEVLPQKTLQAWLFSNDRTATTRLIETALADVRAGVVTIQDVHDVAPPYLYSLGATSSSVYFETPSFPSLTMSEVAITALIMAKIDSRHSRYYEAQVRKYAHEVYASGAHFEADISSAISLAELYMDEMEQNEQYQVLFTKASDEWGTDTFSVPSTFTPLIHSLFSFARFPESSDVQFTDVVNYDYRISYSEENLDGVLRLSLTDTRLPHPGVRLYEYAVGDPAAQILPIALELQQGSEGKTREAVSFANYNSTNPDSFAFLAGKKGVNGKLFAPGTAAVYTADQGIVAPNVMTSSLFDNINDREQIYIGNEAVFITEQQESGESDIIQINLHETEQTPTIIATGTSPSLVFEDSLLYVVDNMQVLGKNLSTNTSVTIEGINPSKQLQADREIRYFSQQNILIVTDTWTDAYVTPMVTVTLYALSQVNGGIVAETRYEFTGRDLVVGSVALSPGGRYIAFSGTKALGGRTLGVLIFDTFDGIIKKEVDLQPFLASPVSIDGWFSK